MDGFLHSSIHRHCLFPCKCNQQLAQMEGPMDEREIERTLQRQKIRDQYRSEL